MLAWILDQNQIDTGFLIGGVAGNFGISARAGSSKFFVIEADEYDSEFFDKRSKFVHYTPKTLIINNLEFDHADIFDDLKAIQRQFHHLVRTMPSQGCILSAADDQNVQDTLKMGSYSELQFIGEGKAWFAKPISTDCSHFEVPHQGNKAGEVNGITVYDDFAHHPTAISATINALRGKVGKDQRILAVLEPRSNTMKMGVHKDEIAPSLTDAEAVFVYQPETIPWNVSVITEALSQPAKWSASIDELVEMIVEDAKPTDHILVMSNGAFSGIHNKIIAKLQNK